ncbi:DHA2 family efflux MFS transporter permease subunit [Ferrovum myxofaciens]|uniref:DHA2 family efflux MFS transporter permease subunit n=1 Tax=Ferrovum myxofaciens TaxID=416213 RepID=UPI0004E0D95F|nr:DHA2 family efflux MFS transporter permease subunit [Ferrovum myxofaciens]MBU6994092.1 DHA2 family efflux MFS transporter permease subunit [Ferrovum myxofaciens]
MAPETTSLNRPLITASVMAATIMQALDSTIANVALPKMQGTLAATQDEMAWVLTSYIVAAAIMIPLTGWLAQRFGRKPVFLISVAGFTFASALCGLATTLPEMVFFRLLQGISGAALVPLSQAVLFDINPRENHGKAMALWGVGVTMGPILGPALGGWLTDQYSWRWVFYINVPIGILAYLGLSGFMPNTKKIAGSFDFFGFLTLSLGIGALQLFLDRGELKDWFHSSEIVVYALIIGISFYLFILHTLTAERPFLSVSLFKDKNFLTSNIFIFIIGVVLFATLALVPPLLQNEMNYPVMLTGFVTAPRGMGTMMAMMVVGRLIGKYDVRLIMAVGLGMTVLSLWKMMHFDLLMDETPIIYTGLLQGFGVGLSYVPLSTVAFSSLPQTLRNEGTAFFNLLRNIGSSIGISIVQTLLTRNTQINHATLAEHITPYTLHSPAIGALDPAHPASILALNGQITRQAAMIAYNNDFELMMVVTLAVMPLLILLRPASRAPQGSERVIVD